MSFVEEALWHELGLSVPQPHGGHSSKGRVPAHSAEVDAFRRAIRLVDAGQGEMDSLTSVLQQYGALRVAVEERLVQLRSTEREAARTAFRPLLEESMVRPSA